MTLDHVVRVVESGETLQMSQIPAARLVMTRTCGTPALGEGRREEADANRLSAGLAR